MLINPIQIFIQIHLFIHCRNFNPFRNSLPFTFLTQIKYFTLNTFKILARVAFFHIYKLNFTQHFSNIEYIFLFRISKSFSPFVLFYCRIKFQTRRKKKSKRTSQRKIQLRLSMCTRCLLTRSTRNSRLCIILARLSTHCTLLVELIRGWEEEGKNITHGIIKPGVVCVYIESLYVESWQKERKICCSMRNIWGCSEGKKRWMKFSGMAKARAYELTESFPLVI